MCVYCIINMLATEIKFSSSSSTRLAAWKMEFPDLDSTNHSVGVQKPRDEFISRYPES